MRYVPAHAASSHDRRYAYASGRIRALETALLGKQRLDRIAEAADLDEIMRLLSDTVYGVHLDEIEEFGYGNFLRNEERRLLDLVDSLSRDRRVSDMLRSPHDFHNLKVALREKVSGRDLDDLYNDLGRFEAGGIAEAVKGEAIETLPDILAGAARTALETYLSSQDPAVADMIVDKAMFSGFLDAAGTYGGLFMKALVRTWIDLANIRAFMRARHMGLESRVLPEIMIAGGLVRLSDFYETYQSTLAEVLDRFEFSQYRRVIEIGGVAGEKDGSFAPLEREIDNALMAFLRITRYFTFGLEVVISYALMKQIEIKVLRLVLAGKERAMSPALIKERIPDGE